MEKYKADTKVVLRAASANKRGLAPLSITYRYRRKPTRLALPGAILISEADWDAKVSKVRKSHKDHEALNGRIATALGWAAEAVSEARQRGEPDHVTVKAIYDSLAAGERPKLNDKMEAAVRELIAAGGLRRDNLGEARVGNTKVSLRAGKLHVTKHHENPEPVVVKAYSHTEATAFTKAWEDYTTFSKAKKRESTTKNMQGHMSTLLAYFRHAKLPPDFSSFTVDFTVEFKDYLNKHHKNYRHKKGDGKKGLTDSSAHSIIKLIRAFIRWAHQRKYHGNAAYLEMAGVRPRGRTDCKWINFEAIKLIRELDLGERGTVSLYKSRALFIFACYTGLRFSDIEVWIPENVTTAPDGSRHIELRTVKTNRDICVPVNPIAQAVLDEYGGYLPVKNEQQVNMDVKELCKMAGLDAPTKKISTQGTVDSVDIRPLHELMTFHSGRRSFINNYARAGVPVGTMMEYTGLSAKVLMEEYYRFDAAETKKTTLLNTIF